MVRCVYACIMMYGHVMCYLGKIKSQSCWRIKLNASLPPGMVNEDDCEDKPTGEDNSVGE